MGCVFVLCDCAVVTGEGCKALGCAVAALVLLLAPAPVGGGGGGGAGVDLSLCSSRACLHRAFIAFSVPSVCDWPLNVPLAHCAAPGSGLHHQGGAGSLV